MLLSVITSCWLNCAARMLTGSPLLAAVTFMGSSKDPSDCIHSRSLEASSLQKLWVDAGRQVITHINHM